MSQYGYLFRKFKGCAQAQGVPKQKKIYDLLNIYSSTPNFVTEVTEVPQYDIQTKKQLLQEKLHFYIYKKSQKRTVRKDNFRIAPKTSTQKSTREDFQLRENTQIVQNEEIKKNQIKNQQLSKYQPDLEQLILQYKGLRQKFVRDPHKLIKKQITAKANQILSFRQSHSNFIVKPDIFLKYHRNEPNSQHQFPFLQSANKCTLFQNLFICGQAISPQIINKYQGKWQKLILQCIRFVSRKNFESVLSIIQNLFYQKDKNYTLWLFSNKHWNSHIVSLSLRPQYDQFQESLWSVILYQGINNFMLANPRSIRQISTYLSLQLGCPVEQRQPLLMKQKQLKKWLCEAIVKNYYIIAQDQNENCYQICDIKEVTDNLNRQSVILRLKHNWTMTWRWIVLNQLQQNFNRIAIAKYNYQFKYELFSFDSPQPIKVMEVQIYQAGQYLFEFSQDFGAVYFYAQKAKDFHVKLLEGRLSRNRSYQLSLLKNKVRIFLETDQTGQMGIWSKKRVTVKELEGRRKLEEGQQGGLEYRSARRLWCSR